MSYELYKFIHLSGIFLLLVGLGARFALDEQATSLRKKSMLFHGLGATLTLIGGGGLIAKLQLGMPGWIHGKMFIWAILALAPLGLRSPLLRKTAWTATLAAASSAAWLAITKPF